MRSNIFSAVLLAMIVASACAFQPLRPTRVSSTRVHENFGLDFAEDSYANTPKEILGEVNYKEGFVGSYNPDALLLGGSDDIVTKIRKNKLLQITADSGILETLERQGLTLSQLEALLPLADKLELLPLANKNKDLILRVAPLLVDTAFLGIPFANSVLGTSASTYSTIAASCFALAGYEGVAQGNIFLAGLLTVLGTPAAVLGATLGTLFGPVSADALTTSSSLPPISSSSGSSSGSKASFSGPRVSGGIGGSKNGQRKRVIINKY